MRFEEPNSAVRWDSPLIPIVWDDKSLPFDRIHDLVTSGKQQTTPAATKPNVQSNLNHLQLVEGVTATIVSNIQAQLESAAPGDQFLVPFEGGALSTTDMTLELPSRPLNPALLQRHRRQYIVLNKQTLSSGQTTPERVAVNFVGYLREAFKR